MRTIIAIISFVCLLIVTCQIKASPIESLQNELIKINEIQADYSSVRHLKGVSIPLKSSGTIFFSRTKGLLLNQTEPFAMQITANNEQIKEQCEGVDDIIYKRAEHPEIFLFYDKINNLLFNFSQASLETEFHITFIELQQGYEIKLQPYDQRLIKLEKIILRTKTKSKQQNNSTEFPSEISYNLADDENTIILSNIKVTYLHDSN